MDHLSVWRASAATILSLAVMGLGAAWAADAPSGLGASGVLSGDGLKQALAGRTLYLATPIGSLPISYRANGTMFSQSKTHAQFTGSESDRGVWWVAQNQVCQRWNTWLDGTQYCFTFERHGDNLSWVRNDGHTGTATLSH